MGFTSFILPHCTITKPSAIMPPSWRAREQRSMGGRSGRARSATFSGISGSPSRSSKILRMDGAVNSLMPSSSFMWESSSRRSGMAGWPCLSCLPGGGVCTSSTASSFSGAFSFGAANAIPPVTDTAAASTYNLFITTLKKVKQNGICLDSRPMVSYTGVTSRKSPAPDAKRYQTPFASPACL